MAMFERAWLPAPAIHETCISKLAGGQRFGPRGAVPNGFPKTINADMVWSGATLQYKPEAWRIHLADDHIQELEEAAAEFEGKMTESQAGWLLRCDLRKLSSRTTN